MTKTIEAAEHDARALLEVSKSLSGLLVPLKAAGLPERIGSAIELAHAEVLRASHLVTCWAALRRNQDRPARLEWTSALPPVKK